MPLPISN